MKKISIILTICMACIGAKSQSAKEYFDLLNIVSQAKEGNNELLLEQSKQLLTWSSKKYIVKREGRDTIISVTPYTALIGHAIYYARINNFDSTYYYLQQSVNEGMDDQLIFVDHYKDFYPIYSSPRTVKLKKEMNKKFLSYFKTSEEKRVAGQVIDMYESDQYIRNHYDYCEKILKTDSIKLESIKSEWRIIDNKNQNAMIRILDDYGYPGKSLMGDMRAECAFFIIQHFKDVEKQKKYYPILKEAVEKGELDPMMLMMIEDRINLKEGKSQKHGTQTFIIE